MRLRAIPVLCSTSTHFQRGSKVSSEQVELQLLAVAQTQACEFLLITDILRPVHTLQWQAS